MELNYLNNEEAKHVIEGNVFMLPTAFNVLTFKSFLDYKGVNVEEDNIDFGDDKINSLTVEYIEIIENLNDKISETIVPHFSSLEDYENQALLNHKKSNFDSEMNYIGKSGIQPFKEVLRAFNREILISNETYLTATTFDLVALFE